MNQVLATCLLAVIGVPLVLTQMVVQPLATSADTVCKEFDTVCSVRLVVEHRLTMILETEEALIYPRNGSLTTSTDTSTYLKMEQQKLVITADGYGSILVIAINGQFPGPRIEAYVGQKINMTIVNRLHTDSITVHLHGIHQKGTPWMDGVAFITQCPVLPGQTFNQVFDAYPPGTNMYHAHIADQRSMGLYGALVVYPRSAPEEIGLNQIVILLQDWNHLMDPETAFYRSQTQQFDFSTGKVINTTYSVDRAKFSRFEFQSGLINGKGRHWVNKTTNNESPLHRFQITSGVTYRFRIIGAMTLYPMRVFIEGQTFTVRGSDAFDIKRTDVESFVIHPGERYDFVWQAPSNTSKKQYMLVAETIETPESLNNNKYHAAEAILEMVDVSGTVNLNPPQAARGDCSVVNCTVLNCPYQYYPASSKIKCLTFNDILNDDPIRETEKILGQIVDREYFFNFGFPGRYGKFPGSVNAREFIFPSVPILTQPSEITTDCDENQCSSDGMCACTYTQKIPSNKLIQMVFTNIGNGAGWSHPIHLHGHSFYVMKMGLGTYNPDTGILIAPNTDIVCTDKFEYCSTMRWNDASWDNGNVTGMSNDPPQKDTIVVSTGGYVVVRFISDNPGVWFLHCHIDLHNTNGMGMVIDEGETKPATPTGFPVCRNFEFNGFPTSKGTRFNFGTENILSLGLIAIWSAIQLLTAIYD